MKEYTVKVSEDRTAWYKPGRNILHRLDGPAVEYTNGDKHWYIEGEYHRLDGPAVEIASGYKFWYIEGKEYSEVEFLKKTNKQVDTCEGKVVIIDGKEYKLSIV